MKKGKKLNKIMIGVGVTLIVIVAPFIWDVVEETRAMMIVYSLPGPVRFSRALWASDSPRGVRKYMAEEMVDTQSLRGKSYAEVKEMLVTGRPNDYESYGSQRIIMQFDVAGSGDCSGAHFTVDVKHGKVVAESLMLDGPYVPQKKH